MNALLRRIFFYGKQIKTFFITRLAEDEVKETVFLLRADGLTDVTKHHAMICLDPFCVAVWLPEPVVNNVGSPELQFFKGDELNANISLSFIENMPTDNGSLLLYKIEKVRNHQLTMLHRLVLLGSLLRSKTSTYHSRKVISALYSYPRSIIIVSYKDNIYHNIFPMDIHGYIAEEQLYILGLRTTNVTLDKILETKRVVVCNTSEVDIESIYKLGKHPSKVPTPLSEMPFEILNTEKFNFPVPAVVGIYREIEIIQNRKMGYHMLLVGKVVNTVRLADSTSSLYHVGFLEFQNSGYKSVAGLY